MKERDDEKNSVAALQIVGGTNGAKANAVLYGKKDGGMHHGD